MRLYFKFISTRFINTANELMKFKSKRKLSFVLAVAAMLFGFKPSQFILEPPGNKNLIHVESGLYVHRETELRVNAARFETPPDDAAPGAVPKLVTSRFFSLGTSSTFFRPSKERHGDYLVWIEVSHLSDDDLKGKTSRGAHVSWEKDGAVTVHDVLEIFRFPPPDISQLNSWSPWVDATSRREGLFGWHAEANKHAAETPTPPVYPFQMRFRLVLSQRMYP